MMAGEGWFKARFGKVERSRLGLNHEGYSGFRAKKKQPDLRLLFGSA
jgi:hypothetical protein